MSQVETNDQAGSSTSGSTLGLPLSFRGHFSHTVDEKGRINLPVEFRKTLDSIQDNRIVLTNYISDGSRCLEGFSIPAWRSFEEKLRAKSRFSAKVQKLENYYLSRASECVLDAHGRILVPAYLRAYAGIEKEVTFTASIHGFRIWDRRVWEVIFSQTEQSLMENPELFSEVDV